MQLLGTSLSPSTTDGLALVTTTLGWSDLYLAVGAIIDWNNGDASIVESGASLTINSGGTIDISPNTTTNINSAVIVTGLITASADLVVNETAYFDAEVDNGNSGAADTIDWTVGNKQKSTLTDNATFTFTAPPGPCNIILKLVQDATGSRNPVWPATVKWSGGAEPTWSTAASAVDIASFYFDGTNYYGQAGIGFA